MSEKYSADRCGREERSCPTQCCREKFAADRESAYPLPPHAVRASGTETFAPSQARNLYPSPYTRVGLDIGRSVLQHRSHSRERIRRSEEAHRNGPAKASHRACSPVGGL